MSSPLAVMIIVESVLALVFIAVIIRVWRRSDLPDLALWALVWCTRVLATTGGIGHLRSNSVEAKLYIGLQACSACALIVILARSELRVLHQRVLRTIWLRVNDGHPAVGPAPSPSLTAQ